MTPETEIMADAPAESPTPEPKKPRKPRAVKPPMDSVEPLPKKARGKKKKAKRVPKTRTPSEISKQIYGVHQMISLFAHDDGYSVTEEQADTLATAVHAVIEEYDLWWMFSKMPIVDLIIAGVMVEGPIMLHGVSTITKKKAVSPNDGGNEPHQGAILRDVRTLSRAPGSVNPHPVSIVYSTDDPQPPPD